MSGAGGPKRNSTDHRVRVADALPLASVLEREMQNFKSTRKLSSGNESFSAGVEWRENPHDDLVLAVAMATWYGEAVGTGESGWEEVARRMSRPHWA